MFVDVGEVRVRMFPDIRAIALILSLAVAHSIGEQLFRV
jgi:hypothetical protein